MNGVTYFQNYVTYIYLKISTFACNVFWELSEMRIRTLPDLSTDVLTKTHLELIIWVLLLRGIVEMTCDMY